MPIIPNWLKEYFKIAIRSVRTRKLRSWLTIIGVVIGVFLIVSLLSLSEGLKGAVLQQLKMMGKDLIVVMPGDVENIMTSVMGGAEISDSDIKAVKKSDGVSFILPIVYKAETTRYNGEKKTVMVSGYDWKDAIDVMKNDMGRTIKEGRWPIPGKAEVILGSLIPEQILKGIKPGDQVVMNGRKIMVAGVFDSTGDKQDDSMMHIDLGIYREITGQRTGAKMLMVKVLAGYDTEKVVNNIKSELEDNRKRARGQSADSSSFTVLSSEKIASIVGNVMGLIQAVVIGFASIAIIVGGIGIMNTMYTSVRERVREIGIMKAIGAKNSTINTIFLIESGIFGLIGGIGGTLLGFILAKSIEIYFQIHPAFYLKASVTPTLLFFSLGFSFLVGCASGFMPARSASKLKPVEALRYE